MDDRKKRRSLRRRLVAFGVVSLVILGIFIWRLAQFQLTGWSFS